MNKQVFIEFLGSRPKMTQSQLKHITLTVFKKALTIDDPVVDVIANKRERPTFAEVTLKLD
jgi:hypothetical protein